MRRSNLDHRAFKSELYEAFARLPKALSSPRRLELIDLLAQGERTVEALATETGMSIANTSQHLQALRAAHLVRVRREGLYAYYRLAGEDVYRLWQLMRTLGETHLAEIDRVVNNYLGERDALEPVSPVALKARLDDEGLIVLDVRPEVEYQAGHIPGARSIPVSELADRLQELPANCEVVAYCRGPYCVFADEAVALLRERGFQAYRLSVGLPDWQAEGLPVEREGAKQ